MSSKLYSQLGLRQIQYIQTPSSQPSEGQYGWLPPITQYEEQPQEVSTHSRRPRRPKLTAEWKAAMASLREASQTWTPTSAKTINAFTMRQFGLDISSYPSSVQRAIGYLVSDTKAGRGEYRALLSGWEIRGAPLAKERTRTLIGVGGQAEPVSLEGFDEKTKQQITTIMQAFKSQSKPRTSSSSRGDEVSASGGPLRSPQIRDIAPSGGTTRVGDGIDTTGWTQQDVYNYAREHGAETTDSSSSYEKSYKDWKSVGGSVKDYKAGTPHAHPVFQIISTGGWAGAIKNLATGEFVGYVGAGGKIVDKEGRTIGSYKGGGAEGKVRDIRMSGPKEISTVVQGFAQMLMAAGEQWKEAHPTRVAIPWAQLAKTLPTGDLSKQDVAKITLGVGLRGGKAVPWATLESLHKGTKIKEYDVTDKNGNVTKVWAISDEQAQRKAKQYGIDAASITQTGTRYLSKSEASNILKTAQAQSRTALFEALVMTGKIPKGSKFIIDEKSPSGFSYIPGAATTGFANLSEFLHEKDGETTIDVIGAYSAGVSKEEILATGVDPAVVATAVVLVDNKVVSEDGSFRVWKAIGAGLTYEQLASLGVTKKEYDEAKEYHDKHKELEKQPGYQAGLKYAETFKSEGYIPTFEEWDAIYGGEYNTLGERTKAYKEKYGDFSLATGLFYDVKEYPGGYSKYEYENVPTLLATLPKKADYIPETRQPLHVGALGGRGAQEPGDTYKVMVPRYKYEMGRPTYGTDFLTALSEEGLVSGGKHAFAAVDPYWGTMGSVAARSFKERYGTGTAIKSEATEIGTRIIPAGRAWFPEFTIKDITKGEWAWTGFNIALITAPVWVPPVARGLGATAKGVAGARMPVMATTGGRLVTTTTPFGKFKMPVMATAQGGRIPILGRVAGRFAPKPGVTQMAMERAIVRVENANQALLGARTVAEAAAARAKYEAAKTALSKLVWERKPVAAPDATPIYEPYAMEAWAKGKIPLYEQPGTTESLIAEQFPGYNPWTVERVYDPLKDRWTYRPKPGKQVEFITPGKLPPERTTMDLFRLQSITDIYGAELHPSLYARMKGWGRIRGQGTSAVTEGLTEPGELWFAPRTKPVIGEGLELPKLEYPEVTELPGYTYGDVFPERYQPGRPVWTGIKAPETPKEFWNPYAETRPRTPVETLPVMGTGVTTMPSSKAMTYAGVVREAKSLGIPIRHEYLWFEPLGGGLVVPRWSRFRPPATGSTTTGRRLSLTPVAITAALTQIIPGTTPATEARPAPLRIVTPPKVKVPLPKLGSPVPYAPRPIPPPDLGCKPPPPLIPIGGGASPILTRGRGRLGLFSEYAKEMFGIPELAVYLPEWEGMRPPKVGGELWRKFGGVSEGVELKGVPGELKETPFGLKRVKVISPEARLEAGAKEIGMAHKPSIKLSGKARRRLLGSEFDRHYMGRTLPQNNMGVNL